jgi:hypothetical protein
LCYATTIPNLMILGTQKMVRSGEMVDMR